MHDDGFCMVRYADDLVVLCRNVEDAQLALAKIRAWVEKSGLNLHPGNCAIEGQGFDFLGYHFEAGRRWVRKKSLKAMRDKVRSRTKRTCGKSLTQVIKSLNPTLRGWFGYFKHADPYVFRAMDGLVRCRLGPYSANNCGGPASENALPITNVGPMPSSLSTNFST